MSAVLLVVQAGGPVGAGRDAPGDASSWIVTLAPDVSARAQGAGLARGAGGVVGLIYEHALNGFQLLGPDAAAAALRRNPNVVAVTPDHAVALTDTVPPGIARIEANVAGSPGGAYQAGYRGSGARIAIIDTGIDLDHPDLVGAIDAASGTNCISPALPPDDGYGHGSHVAGTAAAPSNGIGVVGVAPEAELVPIKVFDDAGNSSESLVLCGLNHAIGLNSDGIASNDLDVISMSFGESRPWGSCVADPLHAAICNASAAGIVLVGGAGNSGVDGGSFVPAAYPEVISVSALTDFDGAPGGSAGCAFLWELFAVECDDSFAFFSNFGTSVDVIAPGVAVNSTWKDGGYSSSSGTSMATPHVSGIAALMKAIDHDLTTADVVEFIRRSGECPNGAWADADATPGCAGQGLWADDPDSTPEPLVNAVRAAEMADNPPAPEPPGAPVLAADDVQGEIALSWARPFGGGSPIIGYVVYRGTTPGGTAQYATIGPQATYTDTAVAIGTTYYYEVAAINAIGTGGRSNEVAIAVSLPWEQGVQGDWVGTYGADGYALLGWYETGDLVALPQATLTLDAGFRRAWDGTTEVRALEHPSQAMRRAATYYNNAGALQLHLTFASAYSGNLHLYALDWNSTARRQTVTVNDGSGPRSFNLSSAFDGGAWMHLPINVGAGGTVTISALHSAGGNSVLGGLFLGDAGTPPPAPPEPAWEQGVRGNWVGSYGADGYALLAWNKTSDYVAMPLATLSLDQGSRSQWSASTADVRALENAGQTERRAATWYHGTSLRLHLTFASAYSGTLHLYALDWNSTARRQTVVVNDGSGPITINLTSSFANGAWLHVPISVGGGGTVTITVDRVAGANAVLSGLFLGGS